MIKVFSKRQVIMRIVFAFCLCFLVGFSVKVVKMSIENSHDILLGLTQKKDISTSGFDSIQRWGLKRNGKGVPPQINPGYDELLSKHRMAYIGDTNSKKLYLTFDEGYENGLTGSILDTLKKHKVKAVFFITKPYLDTQDLLLKRMIAEGHYVGNHTVGHPSLPTLSDANIANELDMLQKEFESKYKQKMMFMRPPKGEFSEKVLSIADSLNYCTLFWSFAYDDWYVNKVRGADYAVNKVCDNIHNGAVILLHAVSKDNAAGLDKIISNLQNEGYTFGDPIELYGKR